MCCLRGVNDNNNNNNNNNNILCESVRWNYSPLRRLSTVGLDQIKLHSIQPTLAGWPEFHYRIPPPLNLAGEWYILGDIGSNKRLKSACQQFWTHVPLRRKARSFFPSGGRNHRHCSFHLYSWRDGQAEWKCLAWKSRDGRPAKGRHQSQY